MTAAHCCLIGGGGFIGGYLVRRLVATGRSVTVVGRRPAPSYALPDKVRYLTGDYAERAFLQMVLDGVDEIVHLAYASVPRTSFDDPVRDITANLPPSVHLFAAASAMRLAKLVLVSSGGTVYGRARSLPVAEDHPTAPISPYGITKLAVEHYAYMYHQLEGLPAVILRPGNAYGPGQKPFTGQGFIATAIAAILQGSEITLFGEHGTVRDYVHAADLAAGVAAALDGGAPGACYNIGTGVGRSNRELIELLQPLAARRGLGVRVNVQPQRSFDVPANVLDSAGLAAATGWRAQIPIEAGIGETWAWNCRALANPTDGGDWP